ncbi:flavin reductase family protein [Solibacillus sp. R5-41]|uniref:flavin reductase family protein n=1 Tax=Solibacillus sp. R5-41 TaxID=2048654 RepID=UPI0012FD7C64|nr:flavin reductase family protein [Solibacillus sp. R5-41]
MDIKLLRQTFGKFATGVTVVTWFDGDDINGITVNSFTSVSLEPALVLVSIDKKANSLTQMQNKAFTINILADDQEKIAWQFAGREQQGLKIEWEKGGIAPILSNAAAFIECKPWKQVDAGDHVLFIGEIENFGRTEKHALTFYEGKMGSTEKICQIETSY